MADSGDLREADADNLGAADNSKPTTSRSQTATFPPHYSEASYRARMSVLLAGSLLKAKAPTFPAKRTARPEAESNDLFQAGGDLSKEDGGKLATARFLKAIPSTQL